MQHCVKLVHVIIAMMMSSNGNIFHVTGLLCREFTGPRWIPHTKASNAELWCFLDLRLNKWLSKQAWGWWFETPSCPLWRHCKGRDVTWELAYWSWDKWLSFCKQHFKVHFIEYMNSFKISLKFVLKGPFNNIRALVQIMTWRLPGREYLIYFPIVMY